MSPIRAAVPNKDDTAAEAFWTSVEEACGTLMNQSNRLNDAAFFYFNPDATKSMKPTEDEEVETL